MREIKRAGGGPEPSSSRPRRSNDPAGWAAGRRAQSMRRSPAAPNADRRCSGHQWVWSVAREGIGVLIGSS
jgi:hypothetical protein